MTTASLITAKERCNLAILGKKKYSEVSKLFSEDKYFDCFVFWTFFPYAVTFAEIRTETLPWLLNFPHLLSQFVIFHKLILVQLSNTLLHSRKILWHFQSTEVSVHTFFHASYWSLLTHQNHPQKQITVKSILWVWLFKWEVITSLKTVLYDKISSYWIHM